MSFEIIIILSNKMKLYSLFIDGGTKKDSSCNKLIIANKLKHQRKQKRSFFLNSAVNFNLLILLGKLSDKMIHIKSKLKN